MEYFLKRDIIASLVPDVLLDGYSFFRTGKYVIRGYAFAPKETNDALRDMKGDARESGLSIPLTYKLPGASSSGANKNNAGGASSEEEATVMNWWRGSELYIRLVPSPHVLSGTNYSSTTNDMVLAGCSAIIERVPQDFIDGDFEDYNASPTMQQLRKKEKAAAQLLRRGILLNPCTSLPGSAMQRVKELLCPLQPVASMLFWTTAVPSDSDLFDSSKYLPLSFVEMPRIGLTFDVMSGKPGSDLVIQCVQRSGFFVKSMNSFDHAKQVQLRKLTSGLPPFLILEDNEGNIELLFCFTRSAMLVKQKVKGCPFNSSIAPFYATTSISDKRPSQYIAYSVHSSGTFLLMSSNTARLHMILLLMQCARYDDVSYLLDGLFLDSETLQKDEKSLISDIVEYGGLRGADSILCKLKLFWRLSENREAAQNYAGPISQIYEKYLSIRSEISQSLLPTGSVEKAIIKQLDRSNGDNASASSTADTAEDITIGSRFRIGSSFRTYALKVAGTIERINEIVHQKQQGAFRTIEDSKQLLRWTPTMVSPLKITTDSVVFQWHPASDKRVAYFVLISSTPKVVPLDEGSMKEKKDESSSTEHVGITPYSVGQWCKVTYPRIKTIGVVAKVIENPGDAGEPPTFTYDIQFPAVSIDPTDDDNCWHEPVFNVSHDNIDPFEVVVRIILGGISATKAVVKSLSPGVEYCFRLFGVTIEGMRSGIYTERITTLKIDPVADKTSAETEASVGEAAATSNTAKDPAQDKGEEQPKNENEPSKKDADEDNDEKEDDDEEEAVELTEKNVADIFKSHRFAGDVNMLHFLRYSRARQFQEAFKFSAKTFKGSVVRGIRSLQWTRLLFNTSSYLMYTILPIREFSLLDAYELMSGSVTWSMDCDPDVDEKRYLWNEEENLRVGDTVEVYPEKQFFWSSGTDVSTQPFLAIWHESCKTTVASTVLCVRIPATSIE